MADVLDSLLANRQAPISSEILAIYIPIVHPHPSLDSPRQPTFASQ